MRAVFIVIAVDPSDQQRERQCRKEEMKETESGELSSLLLICI